MCVFVCVPRLPLLPMLGSLASAIQLYSGGMETGLRSPGRTNQQSESRLRGEGVGVSQVTERQRGRQLEGWTGKTKCVQVWGKKRETLESRDCCDNVRQEVTQEVLFTSYIHPQHPGQLN